MEALHTLTIMTFNFGNIPKYTISYIDIRYVYLDLPANPIINAAKAAPATTLPTLLALSDLAFVALPLG
ncbi:hypothetical protein VCRA2114E365_20270 [Vibrio crassostreae]|nr:hypothetical protein VCRA2119O145_110008 [Vibrio crassostreae]CAK2006124.1 hypothetical protein VCRA2114O367_20241 [Vibrio crassostreae]CAK2009028.1 hypothetical protein VCRA2113O199_20242 [Vibrio crassostreae]CAK2328282.1 hypothetical protein VCRA2114O368_20241 [Vibrio crassostreae]CAK2329667.1 hypothetical protein VCRA2113O361_20240 [Vibrio crassostreae]